jgi:hypothetical protein
VQRALFARGLAVPEPLELRQVAQGVELVSRHLAGAQSLSEIARRPGALRVPPELVARRVGALLAQAHGLGLDHPDLHEQNVIVTPDGQAVSDRFSWRATMRGRMGARPGLAWRDLVQLCGATRERVPRELRQRALVAWWRAVAPALRPAARWPRWPPASRTPRACGAGPCSSAAPSAGCDLRASCARSSRRSWKAPRRGWRASNSTSRSWSRSAFVRAARTRPARSSRSARRARCAARWAARAARAALRPPRRAAARLVDARTPRGARCARPRGRC